MTSSSYEVRSRRLTVAAQVSKPTRAPLHARPIWGIGYTAGLEI